MSSRSSLCGGRGIVDLEVPPKSPMPVHVDHEDIERNTMLMKTGDEIA